ncbi:MAG: DUF4831 family protein [Bacteroidales bacterium]|nr:DUF4831 family protein [Bacteroidales bacterium]
MKNTTRLLLALAVTLIPQLGSAQKKADPEGFLTYSLPSTAITLDVEAVQEKFYAGPYAKYAEKYLGIKARQKDETTFQLTKIKMVPLLEADQSRRYSINVKKSEIDATFLKLSSVGLVSFSDANFGDESVWRFPTEGKGDFSGKGVSSNLTSESTTLYRNSKTESAYNKVAVQQNMVVEKSAEQKAAETAEMILRLRKQRLQIVTGDTDATYSGEAMGAAINEITRLEEEYMTLFTGYSDFQTQNMRFEVVPEAGLESQMYVAFRLSDTAGLVPADNLSGKPIVMEIVAQPFAEPELPAEQSKNKKDVEAYYRIPAVCTVKLMDGANLLLQSRMPIYQLGRESSLPVNVILK